MTQGVDCVEGSLSVEQTECGAYCLWSRLDVVSMGMSSRSAVDPIVCGSDCLWN